MEKILNTPTGELVSKIAQELKSRSIINKPEWADVVKTGTNKARPPAGEDWYFMRAASILLKIYNRGPIGVSKLRTVYGSKKRRGHQPSEFRKGSGSIIRKIMQDMERAELIKNTEVGVHKGRKIMPKGISLISKVSGAKIKVKKQKPERKEEQDTEKKEKQEKKPEEKTENKNQDKSSADSSEKGSAEDKK
jgi:small subunit ribosomal protein S19e